MPRNRPARPCSARRTNRQPCRGFAIVGGRVCAAHGGRAPQVRAAADRRVLERQLQRAGAAEQGRWMVELAVFEHERRTVAGRLLGLPAEDVTRGDLIVCAAFYGGRRHDEAPVPRRDRRYGPRSTTRRAASG